MFPQPATETAARAPEPWCMHRRMCKHLPFSHGLWQTGTLLRTPGSCALGGSIRIGWKGTRISFVGRYACSPSHGLRTTAYGPLLQRREIRAPFQSIPIKLPSYKISATQKRPYCQRPWPKAPTLHARLRVAVSLYGRWRSAETTISKG